MSNEYKVICYGDLIHKGEQEEAKVHFRRVMQYVQGKGVREAIEEHGNVLCESCDYVLAHEGQTISVGHACIRCKTEVVGFCNPNDPADAKRWKDLETATAALFRLEPEDRKLAIWGICKVCGDSNAGCHCWNDE